MREISTQKVLITSFFVDILDVFMNFTVAILTGSVVMIAETLQGLSDLASVGFLIIGFKRSENPADKVHPFGYGREIYFWTLLSALLMLVFTAGLSFYQGLIRFIKPEPITHIGLAYIVLFISIVSNGYAFSLSFRKLLKGHRSNNIVSRFFQSSRAEIKAAFILDLMGTTSALLGLTSLIFYATTGNMRFDGVGAMMIGIFLAILSLLLLASVKDFLVGKSASPEVEERIIGVALSVPEVARVLHLKTVHLGPDKLLVDIEVGLKNNLLTTEKIGKIFDQVKEKIKEEVKRVVHIQVGLGALGVRSRHSVR